MNDTSEFANPALAEALRESDDASNLGEHINNLITTLGKAMQQDTYELRSAVYTRKNFTIGALVAYDAEVRRLASRAGADLRAFDQAIATAMQEVLGESARRNPIGEKLAKAIKDSYLNGNYR